MLYMSTVLSNFRSLFLSLREQSEQELIEEIHRADVICVVYDVNDEDTLTKVSYAAVTLGYL